MKKIFILLFFIVLITCLFPLSDVMAQKDLKAVKVGVYDNPPKIYRDEKGEIKGFWADIVNYIAKNENWDLTYVYGSWDEGLARLQNGDIDLMVDVAVSEDRKQKYDFNNETGLISWGMFYTKKGAKLNSFIDLQNKNIAVLKSGILYSGSGGLTDILTSFGITANIIDVTAYGDVFKLLDSGRADVGVVNWFYGVANEDKFNVERTSIIFQPSDLKFALKKGDEKNGYLISVLDLYLEKMKENKNSAYYQAINKNFGKYIQKVEVTPRWWNGFLVGFGIFLMLIAITLLLTKRYQNSLNREINKRIRDIKESEEKYSAVVSQAQDGIVIVQDQVIKYANKAVSIIGYNDKEILGMPFIKMIAPEEQKKVSDSYNKRVTGEKVEAVYETKLAHKNGANIDVEFSSGLIKYENRPAVLVMVRDITERKKMETKLKELDALKSKFIEIVAHQLRTPLNVIRWSLESLLSGAQFKLEEAAKGSVYNSLNADIEVINRIDDLLKALDIEEGRLVHLNKKPISLENLCESIMIEAKKRCAIKKINCFYEHPKDSLPIVEVDNDRIRAIFEKIINNAILYTKENGKISISLKQIRDKIRFEVTDNGIGIPKSEQKSIFSRFYRATNATPMQPNASGLGLFIAKYFAEQHGGKIDFESEEGKGTTFWFDLPV